MNVAIIGYGVEGNSSAKYWHKLGHDITVCDLDTKLEIPHEYASKLGGNYLNDLNSFDVIVRSAGIQPKIIISKNPGTENKITTNIEEFFRKSPTKNLIGVTGTKGKGTTSTLITKMLQAAGYTAHLVGNIGKAPLEIIDTIKNDDWVVLELSSFQLEDFKGPSPHIAVCLMMVPEHLNWHADMNEYINAKSNLFKFQTADDYAVYFNDSENSQKVASVSSGKIIAYFSDDGAHLENDFIQIEDVQICSVNDAKLLGKHNLQNICAAVTAVWQITPDVEAIASVIKSFSGLEHRLELVRELDGVKYYDDSFATTPETSIAAIESFLEPKVLILGGSDKGIPLDPIADEVVKSNVKHVIAIGDMADIIENLLTARGYSSITKGLTKMTDMVTKARDLAESGDVVLLSTGCASFGLFKDYKDRAKQFQDAVKNL